MEVEESMVVSAEGGGIEFRGTKSGLLMCVLRGLVPRFARQRYIAFGDVAEGLKAGVEPGDSLRLFGYFKTFRWTDHLEHARSRRDFMIQRWERR